MHQHPVPPRGWLRGISLALAAGSCFLAGLAQAQETPAQDPDSEITTGGASPAKTNQARPQSAGPNRKNTEPGPGTAQSEAETPAANAEPVRKTDAQWKAQLSKMEYWVTRQKGTEPAFSGKYAHGKHPGIFTCVGCGNELFTSKTQFASGTGWPSFWEPVRPEAVKTAPDLSGFEARIEVECARCEAHLGHVFDDGPPPTGLRYCMNSVALRLKPFPKPSTSPAKPNGAEPATKKGRGQTASGSSSNSSDNRPTTTEPGR